MTYRTSGTTGTGKTDNKEKALRQAPEGLPISASRTVSRVLYLTVIYLDGLLPDRSSHLLRTAGPACVSSHGVAPDRVYSIGQSPADG